MKHGNNQNGKYRTLSRPTIFIFKSCILLLHVHYRMLGSLKRCFYSSIFSFVRVEFDKDRLWL